MTTPMMHTTRKYSHNFWKSVATSIAADLELMQQRLATVPASNVVTSSTLAQDLAACEQTRNEALQLLGNIGEALLLVESIETMLARDEVTSGVAAMRAAQRMNSRMIAVWLPLLGSVSGNRDALVAQAKGMRSVQGSSREIQVPTFGESEVRSWQTQIDSLNASNIALGDNTAASLTEPRLALTLLPEIAKLLTRYRIQFLEPQAAAPQQSEAAAPTPVPEQGQTHEDPTSAVEA